MKPSKAENILIKSDWIRKYYYVRKVMNSCLQTKEDSVKCTSQLSKAFNWGRNCLDNQVQNLCEKYPKLALEIKKICREYIENLYTLREAIIEESTTTIRNNSIIV